MKKTIQAENYGEILYAESIWTGSATLSVNGTPAMKTSKKTFRMPDNSLATIKGNPITGAKLIIGNDTYIISNPMKWYELLIPLAFLVLTFVWGFSETLCSIIPVVGGAIGGALNALFNVLGMAISATREKPVEKLVYVLGGGLLSFLSCMGVGYIIVYA